MEFTKTKPDPMDYGAVTVTLMPTRYEWTCPKCETCNLAEKRTLTVTCQECKVTFQTG